MSKNFKDKRRLPLQLNYQLDDLKMSDSAFRVYIHLVRRSGKDDSCFPSYRSIGDHCWPTLSKSRRRNKAIEAIAELQKSNLIGVEHRLDEWGYHSNLYYLQDCSDWIETDYPSSSSEPPLVQSADYPSSSSEPPLVQSADYPSSSSEPLKLTKVKLTKIEVNQSKVFSPLPPKGEEEKPGLIRQVEILDPEVQEGSYEQQEVQTDSLPSQQNSGSDQYSAPARVEQKFNPKTSKPRYNDPNWCRQRIMELGARKGNGEWDEAYLEFVAQKLNRGDAYKKNKATRNDARAHCQTNFKTNPSRLLGFAEDCMNKPVTESGLDPEIEAYIQELEIERKRKGISK